MISIIVCTYNRAPALLQCLKSFEALNFDDQWELIVVDNNSSDATAQVIEEFAQQASFPVVYKKEEAQGLGNARNAGIAQASYDIIAFTDDDCYPAADYLEQIASAFNDEQLGFAGGRVLLHDPDDLPVTIKLSETPEFYTPGQVMRPGAIHGANFMFRREALVAAQGFDALFGAGAAFPCEDVDTVAECLRLGWKGQYIPSIVVSHDHGRKTQDELEKLRYGYDIGRGAYYAKRAFKCKTQKLRYLKFWFFKIRKQPLHKTKVEINSAIRYLLAARQHNQRKLDNE
ncbi:glycosyltransferase [Salinimonas sp. HHU 13199]|uniref:Glycosyltransferase n=1 Tax=Salinimonas profundi TaxID=2729140 RepID=A0ABR8LKB9_9ALTE|nr:glycosyltransferase family 2 protein [Salinimonas profundi]MBD3586634.1 glycosyltransferase [Salinimonas profundi]